MVMKLAAQALRRKEPGEYGRGSNATAASPQHDHFDEQQPLDFDHLAGLTSNSRPNEQRLLGLFREQATRDLDLLRQARTTKDWQRAAHSMKGSAAAIGAWRVAHSAGAAMQLEPERSDLERAALLRELTTNLAQVNHIIALRLNEIPSAHNEWTEAGTLKDWSASPTEVG